MSEQPQTFSSSAGTLRAIAIGLLIAIVAAAAFAFHERNTARQLQVENRQIATALRDTQGQLDTLNNKLNAMSAANAPAPAPAAEPAARRSPLVAKRAAARRRHPEDPRWKKMQTQLDAQGKAIESTQQDLASARTELSGSIARTHDELVLLQKKGERNYYEFDLDKSKQFKAEGPVGIRLKKANTKHQYADLEVMVDDVKLSQKHANLYQPVQFYAGDGGVPVELVINSVTKNHIHGYVSAPKYGKSELAAMAQSNTQTAADATAAQPQPARRKLDLPK